MPVRQRHLDLLKPYLIGEQPREGKHGREWDMYCPMHEDGKRSAQLNVDTGVWYCHACEEGGQVTRLIRQKADWVEPNPGWRANGSGHSNGNGSSPKSELPTEATIAGWMSNLAATPDAMEYLTEQRGLDRDTIAGYEIGWDSGANAFTIPVRGPAGEIWNVRRYDPAPSGDRRKIWSITGYGQPRLYPISTLITDNPNEVIICEGEWDALLTTQMGFHAVTRTAAADVWDSGWGELFKGRKVYLCHDRDKKGEVANRKICRALKNLADVRIIELPYPVREKHGKDLTDFWMEGGTHAQFEQLMREARHADPKDEPTELDPSDASVLDSFDSRNVGQPLKLTVTIKGKRDPGYSVPKTARLTCTRDAGAKCKACPMNPAGGDAKLEIGEGDPVILELMESTKPQVEDVLRRRYGALKCNRLSIAPESHQSIEVLYARPSVEHANGAGASAYKNVKITSVGRHDTMPNNTVQVVGALHPDPRKQLNEFLVWEVNRMATSLDNFTLDQRTVASLKKFRPGKGQKPLDRALQIAGDLESHVTRIYGRREMHTAIDLVFHSVLAFKFGGQSIDRGWLELLVVGDTRTGKSEAASQMARHYRAGEVISCESASFAGIVGGLQQYGQGKEWAINWGAIPLNDRRLVILDEISGLSFEEIAQMSDVRSRGLAQLTKIQQEATHARTRLIWMGNPRDGRMADYTYGAQAIKPLVGNPEDIARFDLALSVQAGEVESSEINREHQPEARMFTSEEYATLVRWVWSRTADQVMWDEGAEDEVLKHAMQLGKDYVEDPPLIQAANVRVKLGRVAVALAARLFSTDPSYEKVLVRKSHVRDAVRFLNMIYGMRGFGYKELSKEIIADRQEAMAKRDDIRKWLMGRPGMAKFLRANSTFRRQDLEEIMNVSREEANGIINTLWEARMVRKIKGDVRVEAVLHTLLREVRN